MHHLYNVFNCSLFHSINILFLILIFSRYFHKILICNCLSPSISSHNSLLEHVEQSIVRPLNMLFNESVICSHLCASLLKCVINILLRDKIYAYSLNLRTLPIGIDKPLSYRCKINPMRNCFLTHSHRLSFPDC